MPKRKYALTLGLFVMGAVIALYTKASLGEWTAFATMLLGTFAAADVTDKKLNGGTYDH
jgi:hypothetical protein